ncbi:hypothetical protein DFS34DRAFT_626414 [Phlyctochytrium arcticum]|nr:hypothetical protein DFS34DRAFT_626414 [Phlyctochytrium arcticum]
MSRTSTNPSRSDLSSNYETQLIVNKSIAKVIVDADSHDSDDPDYDDDFDTSNVDDIIDRMGGIYELVQPENITVDDSDADFVGAHRGGDLSSGNELTEELKYPQISDSGQLTDDHFSDDDDAEVMSSRKVESNASVLIQIQHQGMDESTSAVEDLSDDPSPSSLSEGAFQSVQEEGKVGEDTSTKAVNSALANEANVPVIHHQDDYSEDFEDAPAHKRGQDVMSKSSTSDSERGLSEDSILHQSKGSNEVDFGDTHSDMDRTPENGQDYIEDQAGSTSLTDIKDNVSISSSSSGSISKGKVVAEQSLGEVDDSCIMEHASDILNTSIRDEATNTSGNSAAVLNSADRSEEEESGGNDHSETQADNKSLATPEILADEANVSEDVSHVVDDSSIMEQASDIINPSIREEDMIISGNSAAVLDAEDRSEEKSGEKDYSEAPGENARVATPEILVSDAKVSDGVSHVSEDFVNTAQVKNYGSVMSVESLNISSQFDITSFPDEPNVVPVANVQTNDWNDDDNSVLDGHDVEGGIEVTYLPMKSTAGEPNQKSVLTESYLDTPEVHSENLQVAGAAQALQTQVLAEYSEEFESLQDVDSGKSPDTRDSEPKFAITGASPSSHGSGARSAEYSDSLGSLERVVHNSRGGNNSYSTPYGTSGDESLNTSDSSGRNSTKLKRTRLQSNTFKPSKVGGYLLQGTEILMHLLQENPSYSAIIQKVKIDSQSQQAFPTSFCGSPLFFSLPIKNEECISNDSCRPGHLDAETRAVDGQKGSYILSHICCNFSDLVDISVENENPLDLLCRRIRAKQIPRDVKPPLLSHSEEESRSNRKRPKWQLQGWST